MQAGAAAMTLAEDLRTKYALTSFKVRGNCLPLMAINEALEAAAQIADRGDAPAIANQIRALKWQAQTPYASEIYTMRDAA
jgi:hypothetical protein